MELGALICTPRSPQCRACPLRKLCAAFREDRVAELPNPGKRAVAMPRRVAAFVIERKGRFLVRQRPAGVVNAHLWEFPNVELVVAGTDLRDAAQEALGFAPQEVKPLCAIRHSITRYRITLEACLVKEGARKRSREGAPASGPARNQPVADGTPNWSSAFRGGRWLKLGELEQLSFPSAHRRILSHLRQAAPV